MDFLGYTLTIDNLKTNIMAGNLGYGVMDDWEAFVRLGAANAEYEGINGDTQFYWGWGTGDFC